jgi:hypothetical protein
MRGFVEILVDIFVAGLTSFRADVSGATLYRLWLFLLLRDSRTCQRQCERERDCEPAERKHSSVP